MKKTILLLTLSTLICVSCALPSPSGEEGLSSSESVSETIFVDFCLAPGITQESIDATAELIVEVSSPIAKSVEYSDVYTSSPQIWTYYEFQVDRVVYSLSDPVPTISGAALYGDSYSEHPWIITSVDTHMEPDHSYRLCLKNTEFGWRSSEIAGQYKGDFPSAVKEIE